MLRRIAQNANPFNFTLNYISGFTLACRLKIGMIHLNFKNGEIVSHFFRRS